MRALRDCIGSLTTTGVTVLCLVLAVSLSVTPAAGYAADASGMESDRATSHRTQAAGADDSVPGACADWARSPDSQTRQLNDSPVPRNESASVGPSAAKTAEDTETVPLGGIAFVPLSVPGEEHSTVVIGNGTNHTVELAVKDDGDGEATLRINTYLAANGTTASPETYNVTGVESARISSGETNDPMTNRTYPVTVQRNGTIVDEHRLNVTAPSAGTVAARGAPPQLFDAGSIAALRTADELGMVSDPVPGRDHTNVRHGETLVFRIESPAFLGAVAAQPGNTTAEKFQRILHSETPVSFSLAGPCWTPDLNSSWDAETVRALPDYENGRMYILIDTTRIGHYGWGGEVDIDFDDESPVVDSLSYIDFEESRFIDFDNRPDVQRGSPWQPVDAFVSWPDKDYITVRGDWGGSSTITISAQSLVDPTFEVNKTVTADYDYAATLDLMFASDPSLFEVTINNTSYTAAMGDAPNVSWQLAPPTDATTVDRLAVRQLELEDGGFLVAYRPGPNASEFQRVGSAGTRDIAMPVVPIDESQHLVVVPHRDGNDNGRFDGPETDPAYRAGGKVVREWIAVEPADGDLSTDPPAGSFSFDKVGEPPESLVTATPEPTETPTPDPTETQMPKPTDTQSTAPTPSETATAAETAPSETPSDDAASNSTATDGKTDGTAGDGPGFGPLLALVGLVLAAAGLSRRRT